MRAIQYFIVFSLIAVCYGCMSDDNKKEGFFLTISPEYMVIPYVSCIKEVIIETNSNWTISSELPTWLSVDCKDGHAGRSVIRLEVSDNELEMERSCCIVFSYEAGIQKFQVLQKPAGILHFSLGKELGVREYDTIVTIDIEQNVGYRIEMLQEEDDWLEIEGYKQGSETAMAEELWEKQLKLHIAENCTNRKRKAEVIIGNKAYGLSDTLRVTQAEGTRKGYYDGEYLQLQDGMHGNVNLVLMGDGFTRADLAKGGRYESIMLQTMDYFFSIEPFTLYRDYFNVFTVMAESAEAGIDGRNYKFGSVFGSGTAISCNDDLVFEYARKVKELPKDNPLTVIVVLNSTKYAGTTYLYSNGNSIALCPMSAEDAPNDFEGLIHHEAGGHGFGFLCDEYIYYQKTMPDNRKQDIKEWQEYGFQMNLDFTDDTSTILWKDFIGMDKYQQVGAYEGGYEYQYGVWRSEENSCMNNNVPYFNVQSRWCIVSRIMKLSEKEFTVQDFMEADHSILPDAATRAMAEKAFKPLGEPVWIK